MKDLSILGLRLCAIYAWLQAFGYLATATIGVMLQSTMKIGVLTAPLALGIFSPVIAYLMIGIVLFWFSEPLAMFLIPNASSDEITLNHDLRSMAVIAFGVTGVIGFFMAIPRAVQLVVRWFQLLQSQDRSSLALSSSFNSDLGAILGVSFQIVLSFALIISARKFTVWWWAKQKREPK